MLLVSIHQTATLLKFKRDSCFKLIVYYKNGPARTYYSRDWTDEKYGKLNPQLGLKRLETYILRHLTAIETAIIYDKRCVPDKIVRKYKNGSLIICEPVS